MRTCVLRMKDARGCWLACLAVLVADRAVGGRQGPQGAKIKDDSRFDWAAHVRRLNENEFRLRYRLTAPAFYKLLNIIGKDLKVEHEKQAKNSKGETCTIAHPPPAQPTTLPPTFWLSLTCRRAHSYRGDACGGSPLPRRRPGNCMCHTHPRAPRRQLASTHTHACR